MMDVQTLLIGLVLFLVSALLIWIITSLTVQEHPFEERMEHQRQIERDLMLLEGKHGSQSAGPKKDKVKKKPSKKVKSGGEQSVGTTQSVTQAEKLEKEGKAKQPKMVELDIDPTVYLTSLEEPPATDVNKKKPAKALPSPVGAAKPILHNREEKSGVRKTGEAPELIHRKIVPKDAIELKHEQEKRNAPLQHQAENAGRLDVKQQPQGQIAGAAIIVNAEVKANATDTVSDWSRATNGTSIKPKKQKVQKESDLFSGDTPGEVVVKVAQVSTVMPTVPAAGEPNQKKKNKINDPGTTGLPAANGDGVGVNDVVNVKSSNADVIGARKLPGMDSTTPSTDGEGTKKSTHDPMTGLIKQLEDRKKQIEDEKLRTASANDKMNELQLEVTDLRQKLSALAKQSSDQLNSQRQEKAAVTGHIQQLENNAQILRNQIDPLKVQVVDSHNELQRTKAESLHLMQKLTATEALLEDAKQKVKIMDDALKSNAQSYNSAESAKEILKNKNKHLEDQVAKLENLLRESQRLLQMQSENPEIQKAATHIKTLTVDLEQAKSVVQRFEKDLGAKQEDLKISENKLHEISRQKFEIEGRLRLADTQVAELASNVKTKDVELQALRSQLNEARGELKLVQEKQVGDGVQSVKIEPVKNESELLTSIEATETCSSANADFLQNGAPPTDINRLEEVEKLEEQLKNKSNECIQLKAEVEILHRDNAVLHECAQKCDEMKSSLLTLNAQLREMEQERSSNEAHLKQKLADLDSVESALLRKNNEFADMENQLHQLKAELDVAHVQQNKLPQLEAELNDARAKAARLHQLEVELNEARTGDSGVKQVELAVSKDADAVEARLSQKDSELAAVQAKLQQRELDFTELSVRLQEEQVLRLEMEAKLLRDESDHAAALTQLRNVVEENDRAVDLQTAKVDVPEQLADLQATVAQKNAKLADLESGLLNSQSAVAELEAQLRQKETECKDLESRVGQNNAELTAQLSSVSEERTKLQNQVSTLQQEIEALRKAANGGSLEVDIDLKEQQLKLIQSQLAEANAENSNLKTAVDRLQGELQLAQQAEPKSAAVTSDDTARQQELDTLKAALDEQSTKASCLADQLKAEKGVSESLTSLVDKLFPESHINQEDVRQPNWFSKFEKDALHRQKEEVSSVADLKSLKSELDQANETETKLIAQVQHYKNVLSDTETILKRLQDAVETEDVKNQQTLQKLRSTENLLQLKNDEVHSLHQEMKNMHKNSECPIVDRTPAVEHAECVLRRGVSPDKQRNIAELTGPAAE